MFNFLKGSKKTVSKIEFRVLASGEVQLMPYRLDFKHVPTIVKAMADHHNKLVALYDQRVAAASGTPEVTPQEGA